MFDAEFHRARFEEKLRWARRVVDAPWKHHVDQVYIAQKFIMETEHMQRKQKEEDRFVEARCEMNLWHTWP